MLSRAIVVVGPSAVGKTTIANGLTQVGLPIEKVVTTTTRTIRPHETNGIDYHFVTEEQFQDLIQKDGILEWTSYNNHHYGTQKVDVARIEEAGNIPMWVADYHGAEALKKKGEDVISIFILPANFDVLRKRLEKRGLPKQEIINRIKIAQEEVLQAPKADYRVINHDGGKEFVVYEAAQLIRHHFGLDDHPGDAPI